MDLDKVKADWTAFGETDPLWGVLAYADKRGGRWEIEEFMATGEAEVSSVVGELDRRYPTARHDRALDFGCGVGRLSQPLATRYDRVVGVDIAEPMLERARAMNVHGERCRYVLNEKADLSLFEDASFDLVYSSIVLMHIPQSLTLGYLTEFARLLAPNGVLTFTLPSHPARTVRGQLYRLLPFSLINAIKRRRDGSLMAMHAIRRDDVIRHLEDAGMIVDHVDEEVSSGPNWVSFRYSAHRA